MWPPFNLKEYINIALPGLLVTFLTAYGLHVFFDIEVLKVFDNTGISLAFYFMIGLIVGFIIDSCDFLLSSEIPFPELKFFKGHMPSTHLLKRCSACKNVECLNRLNDTGTKSRSNPRPKYLELWFYIFDNVISDYLRSYILSISSACRGVFYLKYFPLFFLFTSISLIILKDLSTQIVLGGQLTVLKENWQLILSAAVVLVAYWFFKKKESKTLYSLSRGCLIMGFLLGSYLWLESGKLLSLGSKFLYVYICAFIYISVSYTNSAREDNIRGIWRKWKNIEDDLQAWVELNEKLLKDLVCNRKI